MYFLRRPLMLPLFPYTTLFRSDVGAACRALGEVGLERGALLRFESVERVRPSELAVPFVIGHDASLESSGASEPRSFRSEEHTSELQSHSDLVCRLLLEKKNVD